MSSSPAQRVRQRFARLASRADAELDLAETALLIAAEEYPDLDVAAFLGELDDLAMAVEPRLMRLDDPLQQVGILARFLHEECGFRGNEDEYYDPRNSFLNDVMARRVGIPISLGVVYLEVARRVGVPLVGVGFPAHFLLRLQSPADLFVDPYHGGQLLDSDGCRELLAQVSRGKVPFEPRYLEPVSNRQILVRMLTNLKAVYFREEEHEKAVAAIDRILLLAPAAHTEVRDRGALYLRMEVFRLALADFERYLATSPPAEERPALEEAVVDLRQKVELLN